MILDKKPPNLFDEALKNLTIIISACPSVIKKALFFNLFNMNYLPRSRKHSKRKLFGMCLDVAFISSFGKKLAEL